MSVGYTKIKDQMFNLENAYKFVSCTMAIFSEMGTNKHTYYKYMEN